VLWVIGIPNAPLWGAIAAVSRFVPYIGGVLAAFFPLLMAASLEPGWGTLMLTGAVVIAAEFSVGHLVEPLLFGSKTRLSPLAVLLAAAFWTSVWGPVGLILAVPLTLSLVVFGEHIPPLAFLRVILGNEPALTAEQRLYHLLLAGDASQAAEEASSWIEKNSLIDYLDQVAIPALAIAAKDSNGGVLHSEQLSDLKEATAEFVEFCQDSAELQRERMVDNPPKDVRRRVVLILPGRGAFDQAAGELFKLTVENHQLHATCASTGGLTAIAAFKEDRKKEGIDYLAMISVGGVTATQLNLLVRRAVRDLTPTKLGIFFHRSVADTLHIRTEPPAGVRLFEDIKDLRRDVSVRTAEASPPRRFETIQGAVRD
jgi:hypothetical protein